MGEKKKKKEVGLSLPTFSEAGNRELHLIHPSVYNWRQNVRRINLNPRQDGTERLLNMDTKFRE